MKTEIPYKLWMALIMISCAAQCLRFSNHYLTRKHAAELELGRSISWYEVPDAEKYISAYQRHW